MTMCVGDLPDETIEQICKNDVCDLPKDEVYTSLKKYSTLHRACKASPQGLGTSRRDPETKLTHKGKG